MIRFHNTLNGTIEPFVPIVPGEVKLYTCGPTVYDFPHIGNCRAYVFEDLLKRFLIFTGFRVTHVMNITDVDDKTIRRANESGQSLEDYTKKYIEAFYQDIDTLGILPADHYPRATEHIPEMVDLVKILLQKGYAYRKEGSVYFSIAKFPGYGSLSKIRMDDLRPGRRVEADEYEKESVHDFALWKQRKDGEPYWETEIGTGRPGWHIECSAMSSKYLGRSFDIHCGGVDNIFPHHENEIAQSEAASGEPFVRTWLHCHHLVVDGEKMSKSKGNFFILSDLLEKGAEPLSVRFLLLATHYRKMLNFTSEALTQAHTSRQRILDFVYELERKAYPETPAQVTVSLIEKAGKKFREGLEDDLNISVSLAAIYDFIREINSLLARDKIGGGDAASVLDFVRALDSVLGILPPPQEERIDPDILAKISEREAARKARDFAKADGIRKALLERGIILEDTKDGVRWKKAGSGKS